MRFQLRFQKFGIGKGIAMEVGIGFRTLGWFLKFSPAMRNVDILEKISPNYKVSSYVVQKS